MKGSCVQKKIYKNAGKTNLVVSKNIDLPILSSVLITAGNDELLIQTTDIEHALSVTIPAKIENEGTCAVSSDVFTRLVSGGVQDEIISIEQKESNIYITTKNSSSELAVMDHSEFPTIPHIETDEETKHITINSSDFVSGLQSVSFAASHSNIKPELSSVFVKYEAGRMYFVCTDGFRLAEKVFKTDLGADEFSLLIPVKSAGLISKIFDDTTEIDLFVTENQIALQNKELYFTCRLVSGNFPDYTKLIPTESETSAVMLKDDLVNVLKLSNIFSNEFHEVMLNIDPKNKLCEITSSNQVVGVNQTNIPAALEGDALTTKFNYRFLAEALPVIHTDSIEMSFTDPGRPIKVTTVPESQFTYIVMPLNK